MDFQTIFTQTQNALANNGQGGIIMVAFIAPRVPPPPMAFVPPPPIHEAYIPQPPLPQPAPIAVPDDVSQENQHQLQSYDSNSFDVFLRRIHEEE